MNMNVLDTLSASESDLSADQCVLILAPRGRDGAVVAQVLEQHGMPCRACANLPELVESVLAGAGLAFATEEALVGDGLGPLTDWLHTQPAWSDFPLVVLGIRHPGHRSAEALRRLDRLGNVVLLERPLNAETLVSAARSALRARSRQYATRRHLEEREMLLAAERSARETAEFAGRMKDEFLATLSHELRTPLSAILGWVHLLKRRAGTSPEIAKGVDTIERNARAQARLIEELLDMSRIVAGNVRLEWQTFVPQALLEAALGSVQPGLEARSIRLVRDFDPAVQPMGGDALRLQQVVWNLLSNAIKFTPVGGSIGLNLRAEDGTVVIEVADSGEGIAPDFLPFVFDRFRQADGSSTRSHGGLGLGLAIVRQLVELHSGSVGAESDGLGRGATFRVRLPILMQAPAGANAAPIATTATTASTAHAAKTLKLHSGPLPDHALRTIAAAEASDAAETASPGLRGVDVLLVDDDADGRETVGRLLEDMGASVVQAGSADEAIAALRQATPDVMVSDIGMPRVDGNELLRHARTLGFRMPAIALTAFARPEERDRAVSAGYSEHLAKPVEPQQLAASIRHLIERRDLSTVR